MLHNMEPLAQLDNKMPQFFLFLMNVFPFCLFNYLMLHLAFSFSLAFNFHPLHECYSKKWQ